MTAGSIPVPLVVPLRVPEPGKSKFCIDTNTRIELRSVGEAEIFYTLNGTKPDPFQHSGYLSKSTMKYVKPFNLPQGKITLKAVAVLGEGKESAINTKTLTVSYVDPETILEAEDNEINFQKELKNYKNRTPLQKSFPSSVWADKTAPLRPQASARFTESRGMNVSSTHPKVPVSKDTDLSLELFSSRSFPAPKKDIPKNLNQAVRASRDTDFLRCISCYAPRPADPYAKFCNECGYPVPPISEKRLPPPEAGEMGMCIKCHNVVPLNTDKCVVCEFDLREQFQPMATLKLADKKICNECCTPNHPNLSVCVCCEARLIGPSVQLKREIDIPPTPSREGRLISCSKCGRVNDPDSRYCDWCGTKPSISNLHLTCPKCTASNQPYSRFCMSCGALLEAPMRADPRNSGYLLSGKPVKDSSAPFGATPNWLPVSVPVQKITQNKQVSTQTVGLFYPSTCSIGKAVAEDETKKVVKEEKKIPLSGTSPGKGYWRQNVDFINNHLKAYAQNNTDFRALIGEPKLGKLISATIHEDGHEMSLTLNFPIRSQPGDKKDKFKGKNLEMTKTNFLNNYFEEEAKPRSQDDDIDEVESVDSGTSDETLGSTTLVQARKEQRKKKRPKSAGTKKPAAPESKLSPIERILIKQVIEKGDIDIIQQMLDEGASANCVTDKDQEPVIFLAVKHKHFETIPILAKAGADMNVTWGPHSNTPLHEAVCLGGSGQEAIEKLIAAKANSKKKNSKGQTPYDIAVEKGYESIATTIASTMGQDMLNKLSKPRSTSLHF